MLARLVRLKEAAYSVFQKINHSDLLLNQNEFKSVQLQVKVLKPFYQITQLLSGEKYASRSLILPARAFLFKMMQPSMQDEEFVRELKKELLTQMNQFFNKYDFVESDQLKAATLLDPSHKDSNFVAEDQGGVFIKDVARHINQNSI